jgi:hypothetical protein
MKRRALIAYLITGLLLLDQAAWAADKRSPTVSSHTAFELRHPTREIRRQILSSRDVSGVVPRAIRGGQPLQMLNPFAPPKYGRAGESVSVDPDDPGRVNGINFVSISF